MTYWQVSCGSSQREFPDVFINFGIYAVNFDSRSTGGYHNYLGYAKKGDILILKKGLTWIHAVGIVQDDELRQQDYYFNFDGWELAFYKYVEWYVPDKPLNVEGKGLAEGTIQKCHKHELQEIANNALISWKKNTRKYEIDTNISKVNDDDIIYELIRNGLKTSQSEILASTLNQVRRLANYYLHNFNWKDVNEDQVRSFLVVPFLLAMGWSEQQLFLEFSIGRKKADIVCFDMPSHKENKKAVVLIEVKKLSEGLTYAIEQAFSYAKELGNVKTICVTNGFCYQIYDLDFSDDPNQPYAYINILEPVNKYPINPQTKGAIEALMKIVKL